MQRGRMREHYQWNMDVVGVKDVTAEVELLAALVHFFESVGLGSGNIRIRVNSRKLLQAVMQELGVRSRWLTRGGSPE